MGAQAQDCNLEKSGNAFQGTSYVVKAKFPAVDTKQALEALRSRMELSGQKILGLDVASGVLKAEQPAKSGGKSLPIAATVRPIEGGTEAAVSIKLNPLQISQDDPVKKELCGYLAALTNLPAAVAAAPAAQTVVPATPAAVAPAVAPAAVPAAAPSVAAAPAKPADAAPGPDTEFSKKGLPCLSGICIGDDISQVKGIAWSATSPLSKNGARTPAPQELARTKAMFIAPEAVQQKIAAAMAGNHFDAAALATLGQVETARDIFTGMAGNWAHFNSDSGHSTLVRFQPAVGQEGGAPVFRISHMQRTYEGLKSQQQVDALTQALQKGYAQIISTHTFAYSKQAQYPSVTINALGAMGKFTLLLTEALQPTWDRQEILRKNAKCGGAKPVSIN